LSDYSKCTGDCEEASADATVEASGGDSSNETGVGDAGGADAHPDGNAGDGNAGEVDAQPDSNPPGDGGPGKDAGPLCGVCDGGCQVTHSTGVGSSFYDCAPVGPLNAGLALEACTTFTGDSAKCTNLNCASKGLMCSSGAPTCDCWQYTGNSAGTVFIFGDAGCNCYSPTSSTWQ
jgi:hypothetical protein